MEQYIETIRRVSKKVKECLLKVKDQMMKRWNKNKEKEEEYEIREEVLVSAERLPSNRPSRKLDNKWRGPFKVVGKKGPAAYELELPAGWRGY
jgi:hypothetical protein